MIKQSYKAKESIYFTLHELFFQVCHLKFNLRISKYVHDMKTSKDATTHLQRRRQPM